MNHITPDITKNKLKIPRTSIFCLFFIFCITASAFMQNPPKQKTPTPIYIIQADSMSLDPTIDPDARILRGNVIFMHDSTFMYCDSAYLYSTDNSLEAFDNVRMEQGDTLFVYGDYLIYEGNTELAKLRYNVRMENRTVTLFTDSLNYDRHLNIGYFLGGGMIVDEENELTSLYGQYSPGTKEAFFKTDVKLTNPKFELSSDTLKYNTITKVATILGPSVIESDSGTIYSSRGWYNTTTDQSVLYDRSTVFSKDKTKSLTGDSLYYNRASGFGEAFGNMELNDTLRKVILLGNYGYYDEINENAFATDSAQMIEYSQGDSLFLHADTLRMTSVGEKDKEIKAYYGVRFYRSDLQGVCDSLQFNSVDTVLTLYKDPILWNTGYQITGDTILVFLNDSTIERVHVNSYAFASEKVDTTYFNQLKGRYLYAYFYDGELYKIYVNGNAETIFYPVENDGAFTMMNKTESSYFTIYMKDRKLERMVIWPEPKGNTMPLPDLTPEVKFLKSFTNFDYIRPLNKEDIFRKTVRKAEDVPPPRVRRSSRQQQ